MYVPRTRRPEPRPLHCLEGATRRPPRRDSDAAEDERPGRQALLCVRCRQLVTREQDSIEVGGRHEHVCANPHGVAYRVRCFRNVPGCYPEGKTENYFSWFPGYTWQIVCCVACSMHLGWRFRAAGDSFHGLIADRIVRGDPGEA